MSIDLAPGAILSGGSRTVTDAEIALLPAMMGAINPLFHDDVAARASPLGGRILYGPALLGISIALTEHLLRDRVRALIEISTVRFRRPVFSGDTVSAGLVVRDLAPRDGRDGLILSVDDEVRNQDGVTVLTFSRRILVAEVA